MVDFLIAVFGIVYFSVRITSGKISKKVYDRETKQRLNEMSSAHYHWSNKVIDRDLEEDIDEFIKKKWNDEIFEEVKPYLKQIKPYKKIETADEFHLIRLEDPFLVKRILMAKKGKLSYRDATSGIRSPGVLSERTKEKWKEHREVMLWLDKELQSHGVEPMLFVESTRRHYQENKIYTTPLERATYPISGYYLWWSARMFVTII